MSLLLYKKKCVKLLEVPIYRQLSQSENMIYKLDKKFSCISKCQSRYF